MTGLDQHVDLWGGTVTTSPHAAVSTVDKNDRLDPAAVMWVDESCFQDFGLIGKESGWPREA